MKLDRTPNFGEIYGTSEYRYEQDGNYFDGRGNLVCPTGVPTSNEPKVKAKKDQVELKETAQMPSLFSEKHRVDPNDYNALRQLLLENGVTFRGNPSIETLRLKVKNLL